MMNADVNKDSKIDIEDIVSISKYLGLKNNKIPDKNNEIDLNKDGIIDIQDLVIVGARSGMERCIEKLEEPKVIAPSATDEEAVLVNIIAPPNSKIVVNNIDIGITIPLSGEKTITLDTSGNNGEKYFQLNTSILEPLRA
jgi:hypothetical protein